MSTDLGPSILALDELLCSPEQRVQLVEQGRAALPVAQLDQFDAAVRENLATAAASPGALAALSNLLPMLPALGALRIGHEADFADRPGWLRLGAVGALVHYMTGTGTTCEHTPSPARPGLIFACAWRPEAFTCRPCAPMLYPAPGTELDITCDECGRVCDPSDSDGVKISRLLVGPLEYAYGQCAGCRTPAGGVR